MERRLAVNTRSSFCQSSKDLYSSEEDFNLQSMIQIFKESEEFITLQYCYAEEDARICPPIYYAYGRVSSQMCILSFVYNIYIKNTGSRAN